MSATNVSTTCAEAIFMFLIVVLKSSAKYHSLTAKIKSTLNIFENSLLPVVVRGSKGSLGKDDVGDDVVFA